MTRLLTGDLDTNGFAWETLHTRVASEREKLQAWVWTFLNTLGNSLYHWTQIELIYYFDMMKF